MAARARHALMSGVWRAGDGSCARAMAPAAAARCSALALARPIGDARALRPFASVAAVRAGAPAASPLPLAPAAATSSRAVQGMGVRRGRKVAVVLTEQLDNLGHRGEEVTVKPGYARNYLVPFRKAVYATTANRAAHKVVLPPEDQRRIAQEREVNMLRARISTFKLRLMRATNDGTNLYGSVTPADIVEALQSSPFRKLGVRDRNVRFPLSAAAAAAEAASGGAPPPADGDALRAIKVVGDHVVEIEARPGLWCAFTLTVGSS